MVFMSAHVDFSIYGHMNEIINSLEPMCVYRIFPFRPFKVMLFRIFCRINHVN